MKKFSNPNSKFVFQIENPDNIIEIQNASFLAGGGDSEQLKNISVEIKSGSLTAIVGHVGCGKSLLLQSILGKKCCKKFHIFLYSKFFLHFHYRRNWQN